MRAYIVSTLRAILAVGTIVFLFGCGGLQWPLESKRLIYQKNTAFKPNQLPKKTVSVHKLKSQRIHQSARLEKTLPMEHVVSRGETLIGIARAYNIDIYKLAIINHIEPPFRIFVGQSLVFARESGQPVQLDAFKSFPNLRRKKQSKNNFGKGDILSDIPKKQFTTRVVSTFKVKPSHKPTKKQQNRLPQIRKTKMRNLSKGTILPPEKKGSKFIWPINGMLVSNFGSKGDGLRNDGVNIKAPRGTVVRAAQAGRIVYSGNELKGFGNLILIKHPDGWVTAYAHNDQLAVKKGDKVDRGQIIAYVGSSGNVEDPQLHFEIRKGNRAIDPVRQISFASG